VNQKRKEEEVSKQKKKNPVSKYFLNFSGTTFNKMLQKQGYMEMESAFAKPRERPWVRKRERKNSSDSEL